MENEKRLTWKRGLDGFEDIGLREGVTVGDAICKLADLEEKDAVEVVHGRWIFKHNPITDPKGYFIRIVCSECNLHTGQKSNYCPQCGAKMDGDGNGAL